MYEDVRAVVYKFMYNSNIYTYQYESQGIYFIIVLWADYLESAKVNRFQWTPWYGNGLSFICNWFQAAPFYPWSPFPGPPGPPHFYAGPTTVRQRPSFYVQSVPSEKVLPFIHLEICSFFFDTMYTTTSTLVCISLIKVGYGILNCVEWGSWWYE